jgi:hypothetical protein
MPQPYPVSEAPWVLLQSFPFPISYVLGLLRSKLPIILPLSCGGSTLRLKGNSSAVFPLPYPLSCSFNTHNLTSYSTIFFAMGTFPLNNLPPYAYTECDYVGCGCYLAPETCLHMNEGQMVSSTWKLQYSGACFSRAFADIIQMQPCAQMDVANLPSPPSSRRESTQMNTHPDLYSGSMVTDAIFQDQLFTCISSLRKEVHITFPHLSFLPFSSLLALFLSISALFLLATFCVCKNRLC